MSSVEKSLLQFHLDATELPLIAAALGLGEWLLAQPETSRAQRKIIEQMQKALRALPTVPSGLEAEFGFHFRTMQEDALLYRAWRVALSSAGLEIYSVYTPDLPIELREKMSHELNFWIKPGETSGHDGHYLAQWIEEVRNPAALRAGAMEFAIYAAYFD
ncbi:MAG: hypothetical protein ACRENP_01420 [Longimicrobiales bacterium]